MFPGIVLIDPTRLEGKGDIALRPVRLASGSRDEAWLRDFLFTHPSVLPTASIDAAYVDPIPVCRELRTPAGRIDCLFVTRYGGLVSRRGEEFFKASCETFCLIEYILLAKPTDRRLSRSAISQTLSAILRT